MVGNRTDRGVPLVVRHLPLRNALRGRALAAGALLFPSDLGEYGGYEDFFLKRRAWFFVAWGLSLVLDIGDTWIKGPEYFANLTPWYLAQAPVGVALAAIAIWTSNRAFHFALVIDRLLYQAFWVVLIFYTPA